jgi:hypothetical protein
MGKRKEQRKRQLAAEHAIEWGIPYDAGADTVGITYPEPFLHKDGTTTDLNELDD